MTVNELSERMTAGEETSWIAYYREEPFGDQRADMRSAQVTQMLHNVNAKKGRELKDFLLFYRKPVKVDPNVNQSVRSFFGKLAKRKE